ncbi:unnamed protein product [Withania somnifera]
MATDYKFIPLIDVSPLLDKWDHLNIAQDEDVAQIVRQLDQACREAGFFYVKGHGIPISLMKEIKNIAREYFHQPNEEKIKIELSAATGCREVKHEMYEDLGDVMQGSNIWPSNPPNFRQLMEEYIDRCTGIALALGGSADEMEGEIGGLLTLVNQDDGIDALQVRNKSGQWILAPLVPGAFVCNIGDMLKILSNGIYESTLHRVTNNSPKFRVCVAYFYEPNFDAGIEPLDVCLRKTGGTKNFEGAVYGKHLVCKVTTNFVSQGRLSVSSTGLVKK